MEPVQRADFELWEVEFDDWMSGAEHKLFPLPLGVFDHTAYGEVEQPVVMEPGLSKTLLWVLMGGVAAAYGSVVASVAYLIVKL